MSNDILTELRQRGAAIERQGETDWAYDDAADEIERLRLLVAELEKAICRLAEQDATLSVCDGNVIVTMDATLTDAEREALEWASKKMRLLGDAYDPERAATLRGLMDRRDYLRERQRSAARGRRSNHE